MPVIMTASILILFAGFFLYGDVLALVPSPSDDNVVDLGYASYFGNKSFSDTVAYLGIPYAEPPLGERRFRAPITLNMTRINQSSSGEPIDATQYPDFCVQGSTGGGDAGGAGSEDCLKVNIYAPAGAQKGSKLPVLVYIHGGGYVFGNPRNWPFDGWIHQSQNVVIVSVYYRLDSFGFLAHSAFSDPSQGDFNVGFQDQIQALKWVQQHIDAFGGDPNQVTINGESAGGSSVELHLVVKESQGLFAKAIAQSVYRTPVPTPAQQEPLFDFYAQQAGCGTGTVSAQLACLRNASISALARAQDAASSSALPYNVFHPALDGNLITDLPTKSILSGNFAHVPLIVGSTSNETLSGGTNMTASLKTFFPSLTDEELDRFLEVYPQADFDSVEQRAQVATGESQLICARAIMGDAFTVHEKTWTYRYNQPDPTSGSPVVGHAAENFMMFSGSDTGFNGSVTFTPLTPTETSFSEELIAYWLSFVRAGDPNTFKLSRSPTWAPYTLGNKTRIVLQQQAGNGTTGSGSHLEEEPTNESARCVFVANLVAQEQN